jgi:hypothetical protein
MAFYEKVGTATVELGTESNLTIGIIKNRFEAVVNNSIASKGDLYRALFVHLRSVNVSETNANKLISSVFANGNVGAVRNQTTANNSEPIKKMLRVVGINAVSNSIDAAVYGIFLNEVVTYRITFVANKIQSILESVVTQRARTPRQSTPRQSAPRPSEPTPSATIIDRTPPAYSPDTTPMTNQSGLAYFRELKGENLLHVIRKSAERLAEIWDKNTKLFVRKTAYGYIFDGRIGGAYANSYFEAIYNSFMTSQRERLSESDRRKLLEMPQYHVYLFALAGGRVSIATKLIDSGYPRITITRLGIIDDLRATELYDRQSKVFDAVTLGGRDAVGIQQVKIYQLMNTVYGSNSDRIFRRNVSHRNRFSEPDALKKMILLVSTDTRNYVNERPTVEWNPRTNEITETSSQPRTPTPSAPSTTATNPTVQAAVSTDVLIRDTPFTKTFGVEWEHFGLNYEIIKEELKKLGQRFYRRYVPTHSLPDDWDGFPNRVPNKGEWALQIDGSVSPDSREPSKAFSKAKAESREGGAGGYNTYYGELVSPVLGGKKGLAIIKTVANALVSKGMRHNKTMGMHVHMEKDGMNLQAVKNLLCNYIIWEKIIEGMFEPNRRGGFAYNKPFYYREDLGSMNSVEVSNWLKRNIQDLSPSAFQNRWGSTKQQPVNLLPYFYKHTIEFRSHGGNFEADTVPAWVLFLHFLMEFSKKKVTKDGSWYNLTNIMPVGLSSFWYNRIQDLTGKSPYDLNQFDRIDL